MDDNSSLLLPKLVRVPAWKMAMTQVTGGYDLACSDALLEKVSPTSGKQQVLRLAAQHRPLAQDDAPKTTADPRSTPLRLTSGWFRMTPLWDMNPTLPRIREMWAIHESSSIRHKALKDAFRAC